MKLPCDSDSDRESLEPSLQPTADGSQDMAAKGERRGAEQREFGSEEATIGGKPPGSKMAAHSFR